MALMLDGHSVRCRRFPSEPLSMLDLAKGLFRDLPIKASLPNSFKTITARDIWSKVGAGGSLEGHIAAAVAIEKASIKGRSPVAALVGDEVFVFDHLPLPEGAEALEIMVDGRGEILVHPVGSKH